MSRTELRKNVLKTPSRKIDLVSRFDLTASDISREELVRLCDIMKKALLEIESASWPDKITSHFNYMNSVRKTAQRALEESSDI